MTSGSNVWVSSQIAGTSAPKTVNDNELRDLDTKDGVSRRWFVT